MVNHKWLSLIILSAAIFIGGCQSPTSLDYITIGTGGVTGVYYPTGGAIARLINQQSGTQGIKASVESTAGSVYNINAVLSGDLELGIAQSDRQYQAYHGKAEWEKSGKQSTLRSLFSIHPESVTLIVSANENIKSINDLKGKRVNLGNPGSGQLQNSKDTLNVFNISLADINPEYVKAVEAPGLLQDERIDAFFYTVGHPAGNIKEATSGRIKVNIVELIGPTIDALIKERPYYTKTTIPITMYPNAQNEQDIKTFGVKATVVASAALNTKLAYAVTRAVFENFDEFKKMHPAYQVITKEQMLEGLSAPIHPGAYRYYQEVGLDKFIDPNLIIHE